MRIQFPAAFYAQKRVEIFASFITTRPKLFAVSKLRRLSVVHAFCIRLGEKTVARDALTTERENV
jgi:hypothetical protein